MEPFGAAKWGKTMFLHDHETATDLLYYEAQAPVRIHLAISARAEAAEASVSPSLIQHPSKNWQKAISDEHLKPANDRRPRPIGDA